MYLHHAKIDSEKVLNLGTFLTIFFLNFVNFSLNILNKYIPITIKSVTKSKHFLVNSFTYLSYSGSCVQHSLSTFTTAGSGAIGF